MPTFPRDLAPSVVSPLRMPAALASWGQAGKGQFRETVQRGREWDEEFPPLDMRDPVAWAFVLLCGQYLQGGQIFDVDYRLRRWPLGAGGGAPLVNGASQTGLTLNVDGCPISVNGWLKNGDLFTLPNLTVRNATADVNTNGAGQATIPLYPAILSGESPADNAVVTVTGVTFRAVIAAIPGWGEIPPGKYLGGFKVTFREQPA